MTHHINYEKISWEEYEDLCTSLWFDEGYKDIKPMGRRYEGGRDAIFVDSTTGSLTIFQYKRWTKNYDVSKLKTLIRNAITEIVEFSPKTFILNSSHESNAKINDWIQQLTNEFGFDVQYWDRTWTDLRLDNARQDLRYHYFDLNLLHHTMESLVSFTFLQVSKTITELSNRFNHEIYIKRKAEEIVQRFFDSSELGLAIVDRSGRGKTNLFCNLARNLVQQGKIAIFIKGEADLIDDNGFERLVANALGYGGFDYQACLKDVSNLLAISSEKCVVFLDGISESENLNQANRSLKNLLFNLNELKTFKICFSCREVVWPIISYDLPSPMIYQVSTEPERRALYLDDFHSHELDEALIVYSKAYNVNFKLSVDAKSQLKHPLLLRFFCETNRNKDLGYVSVVSAIDVFQKYLDFKTQNITMRMEGLIRHSIILRWLRKLAGQMWHHEDSNTISEVELFEINAKSGNTIIDLRTILDLLQVEGVIFRNEEPATLEASITFVFDQLREFLLLQYLISKLPERVSKDKTNFELAQAILSFYSSQRRDLESYKLLTLIGMFLQDFVQRQAFLEQLLDWDLQTFCACLAYIPLSGDLNLCTYDSLLKFGDGLRHWFLRLSLVVFLKKINTSITHIDLQTSNVILKLVASPECREVTYVYSVAQHIVEHPVSIKQIDKYPTFRMSLANNLQRLELHNPEGGIIIPSWRTRGNIHRTINESFSPVYVGQSFGVPERVALYDVWEEIAHVIKNKDTSFPLIPSMLTDG